MDGFFKITDPQIDELGGVILEPNFWWSRRFEHPFALSFIEPGDTILDAACGTTHPFKYVAGDMCKKVHACDLEAVPGSDKYEFTHADIINLPYKNKLFNKIFCISVLEHLEPQGRAKAIDEFYRTLKPKGTLILTVDHPTCDLDGIYSALEHAGFITNSKDYSMEGAVDSTYWGVHLRCYHIVAKKE